MLSFLQVFLGRFVCDTSLLQRSQCSSKAQEQRGPTIYPAGPEMYPPMPSTTAEKILPPHFFAVPGFIFFMSLLPILYFLFILSILSSKSFVLSQEILLVPSSEIVSLTLEQDNRVVTTNAIEANAHNFFIIVKVKSFIMFIYSSNVPLKCLRS